MKNKEKKALKITQRVEETDALQRVNKKTWKKIGIACSILLSVLIVACIINIYKAVSDINVYAGYAVLAVLVLLLIIFVIVPIIKIKNAPNFIIESSIEQEKITAHNYIVMKHAAQNLIKDNNSIPFEEKEALKECLNNKNALKEKLKYIYKKYLIKDLNEIIWATSLKVAGITAFSKNSSFDSFTVIISNIKMVMQIVVKCGYRPSYTKLAKLISKVFANAILAYTIQTINFGEIVVNLCSKFFKKMPAVGSVIEGASNGFLTARVGVLTKKYLFKEFNYSMKNLTDEEQEMQVEETVNEARDIIYSEGKTVLN